MAAGAAVWQTRVIANQLSATVWPYLSFSLRQDDTVVRYTLTNDGLGPAIVRSAGMTVDGKKQTSLLHTLLALAGAKAKHASLSTSSVGPGTVLRPDASFVMFLYTGSAARTIATDMQSRVHVRVCYCSLLEQCWTITSATNSDGPVPTPRCTQRDAIDA
jgi:hypothetical protein